MPDLLSVKDAILRPTRPGEKGDFHQVCGVFSADGAPIPAAQTTTRVGPLCLPCSPPAPGPLPLRTGRWLFGGIGFHHFGHALIFSTARLWALDHLTVGLDGLVFLDRGTTGATRPGTTRNLQHILDLLGVDLPVVTVGQDERVAQLVVPDEGISTAENLFDGTPAFHSFIRQRISRVPANGSHRRVYVSRSGLGLHRNGLMFEDRIEAHLAAAGYHIFHPQRVPLHDQIAMYAGASHIIGVDGSALHLVAFAAAPDAKVAVLGRRPYYPHAIASQIERCSGASATALPPGDQIFVRSQSTQSGYPWFWTHCLPDLPRLGHALQAAGFLDTSPTDWLPPDAQALQERLALISRRNGYALVPLPHQGGSGSCAPPPLSA